MIVRCCACSCTVNSVSRMIRTLPFAALAVLIAGVCGPAAAGAQAADSIVWRRFDDASVNFPTDSVKCAQRSSTLAGTSVGDAYFAEVTRCLSDAGWVPLRVVTAKQCDAVTLRPVTPLPKDVDSATADAATRAISATLSQRLVPSSIFLETAQTAHSDLAGRILVRITIAGDKQHLESRAERVISGPALGDELIRTVYIAAPAAIAGNKAQRGLHGLLGGGGANLREFEAVAAYDVNCSPYRPLP